MAERRLPVFCPSCETVLKVKSFECPDCGTEVEGAFALPILVRLQPEEQAFVLNLLESSGSLKELARLYEVSYPTVRNRLDALRAKVKSLREAEPDRDEEG